MTARRAPAGDGRGLRNRIVGEGTEAPDQLLANPQNWRIHPGFQQEALDGVLAEVGWVQRVIVNKRTGHLVDGHLRVQLADARGEESVPVLYVDLSAAEEKLVLSTLDPLAGLAVPDNDQLLELLGDLDPTAGALEELLDQMGLDAEQGAAAALGLDGEKVRPGNKLTGAMANQIRPIIAVADVSLVERALRATGCLNRGEAFVEVCRRYLDDNDQGQFDPDLEGEFPEGVTRPHP